MSKPFKYLRYITAGLLVSLTTINFVDNAIYQANFGGFDGPLAWFSQYTHLLNRVALAILLAAVLVIDFELKQSQIGLKVCRIASGLCIVLTLIGFIYLIRHQLHFVGMDSELDMLRYFLIPYLLQLAYFMTAIILLVKTTQTLKRVD
jgi:hypothetical protein